MATNDSEGDTNFSDPDAARTAAEYAIIFALYPIVVPCILVICLAAFFLNAYILSLSCVLRRYMSTVLLLTFGLAAADCWTSLDIAIGLVINSLLPKLGIDISANSSCPTLVVETFRIGGIYTSNLHLLLLAVHHFLSIACPHGNPLTERRATVLMMVVWVMPPGGLFIAFSLFTDQGYQNENCDDRFIDQFSVRLPICLLVIAPLVFMVILYVLMMVQLNRLQGAMKQGPKKARMSRATLNRKRRAMTTTLIMVGSFLISWLPTAILYLISSTDLPLTLNLYQRPIILFSISVTANVFMTSKYFINPIIYAFRVPEIHDNICFCICGKRQTSLAGYSTVRTRRSSPTAINGYLERSASVNSRGGSSFRHRVSTRLKPEKRRRLSAETPLTSNNNRQMSISERTSNKTQRTTNEKVVTVIDDVEHVQLLQYVSSICEGDTVCCNTQS